MLHEQATRELSRVTWGRVHAGEREGGSMSMMEGERASEEGNQWKRGISGGGEMSVGVRDRYTCTLLQKYMLRSTSPFTIPHHTGLYPRFFTFSCTITFIHPPFASICPSGYRRCSPLPPLLDTPPQLRRPGSCIGFPNRCRRRDRHRWPLPPPLMRRDGHQLRHGRRQRGR